MADLQVLTVREYELRLLDCYGLTGTEARVAALINVNWDTYDIAHAMNLSALTVELYRARLMSKLWARDEAHLRHLLGTMALPPFDAALCAYTEGEERDTRRLPHGFFRSRRV